MKLAILKELGNRFVIPDVSDILYDIQFSFVIFVAIAISKKKHRLYFNVA